MPRAIISPSVLASDFGQLTAECTRMIKGGADWLHMDVMDGHFVPNITMGAPILSCVHKGVPGIFMDVHMMVSNPEQWVDDVAEAGGALYCFHIEAASDPIALIHTIHKRNMKAGVAISPDTLSTAITDEIGNLADMLLVMTVYPGSNVIVAGTAIFGADDPPTVIQTLKDAVNSAQAKISEARATGSTENGQ
ncbi:hypothetical protein EST38_g2927 [Candolleomyces aberdarensis]|uniref:Ribulose-phosphate 3-epimerase n=1 Tax=Candolleomyces aberdarensis TaxID=2316362 RepID=A0A4Q2DR94_9AGAR|nr:hypothetical protein EST38_g2927 [Candolleomyces aberdarensis]